MHDELVKRLREADISHPPVYLFNKAADAIEELSKRVNALERELDPLHDWEPPKEE